LGLLLDLAVAALAVAVAVSLGLLALTLGVTAARGALDARDAVRERRRAIGRLEREVREEAERARDLLRQLSAATSRRQGDR
jgi:hypothetical protein